MPVLLALGLALLSLLLNAPVVGFEWFVSDDEAFVIRPLLESSGFWSSLATPGMGHAMPGTLALYRVAHGVGGLDPAAFHALSLLGAMLAAALFAPFAWVLLGERPHRPVLVALAGALFVVHPVTAEPVAWIAALKDVAPLPLLLAAGAVAISYDLRPARPLATIVGLFAAAMACKPSSAALVPFVLYLAAARGQLARGTWVALACMTAAGGLSAMYTSLLQARLELLAEPTGAVGRLARAGYIAAVQAQQVLLPTDLLHGPHTTPERAAAVPYVLLAMGIAALVGLVLVDVRGRRLRAPGAASMALVWMVAMALPNSGLAGSTHRLASDRYLYAALPGASLLAVLALAWLWRQAARAPAWSSTALRGSIGVAVAGALIALTVQHRVALQRWSSSPAYYAALVERFPPQAGDAFSQQICVAAGRSWLFRRRSHGPDDIERAEAVLRTCDPELAGPSLRRVQELRGQ